MWELIQYENGKYESSLNNVTEELLWVKKQIQRELSGLQQNVEEGQLKNSFFERKDGKVEYHMDLVKEYLQSCAQKEDFQVNWAVVMAVQIALESSGYEVGVIDWLLKTNSWATSKTEKAISKFQKDNNLRVDWVPWKKTISKILEILWATPQWNDIKEEEHKEDKGKDEPEKVEWKKFTEKELLALEIYRWKVMTDEEIEKRGYDPKEIWNLVKNTERMERLDKIIPKNIRHEQVTQILKVENNSENVNNKQKKAEETPEEGTKEKPTEKKESNDQKESWESVDILVWPRLEATNRKELWGIWSSIMYWFQWYGMRSFWFSNMAWRESWKADASRFEEENWKLKEAFILPRSELIDYCKNHNIKSFMFYFGWNEKTEAERQKALANIEKWWDYLEKWGIQPVLCTCIWEEIKEHQDESWNYYVKEYNKAIREMQQRKWWPLIDFVKIDQPDIFRPNDWWHPWDTWYRRMWTKIEQCFSSAEK